jgi:hypothetical protein
MIKTRFFTKLVTYLVVSLLLGNCAKVDPITGEKILIDPNADRKATAFRDKGGGLFGDIGNKKSESMSVNFSSANVLWKATLKTLDFLPLSNTDYSGGIIVYDWYSQKDNPNEQIKISVRFLSNELRADSIQVITHKKICDNINKCSNSTIDEKFSQSIKESIMASARSLKIEEAKKDKK